MPQYWVIHDMDNTGVRLLTEILQGYGVLAQLCPDQQQQQQATFPNVGGANTSNSNGCQEAQEVIHILRYLNLGARLGFTSEDIIANSNIILNNTLAYQIQKLQEAGYRDIKIVNSTDTTVNVDINTGVNNNNGIAATVPATLVEMTYRTDFAPNETRKGYSVLTATDATLQNLGTITGYSIFYEDNSSSVETTTASRSLPLSLPTTVRQVFDPFELMARREIINNKGHTFKLLINQSGDNNDD
jgi:hypothetical protein